MRVVTRSANPDSGIPDDAAPEQQAFLRRVQTSHRQLGIPEDYAQCCKLPLFPEPEVLAAAGPDCFGRSQRLTPAASAAWKSMRAAASADGIELELVSAFRDLDYQHGLIARKLERGQCIGDILQVNAAPGYSEHHSGRAVDLSTPGCEVLHEDFAQTPAYRWLQQHAGRFGFHLSYPVNNPFGIAFEPWHWCYRD